MIVGIFSIYDVKAEVYLQPFFAANAAVAERIMTDEVRNPNSVFSRHPRDFQLFKVGDFNDVQGPAADGLETVLVDGHSPMLVCGLSNLIEEEAELPLLDGMATNERRLNNGS